MDVNNRRGTGIELLLSAEQESQEIVTGARNGKLSRMRQARDEADTESMEYRALRESEFQKKLAESSGDSGANVKRLEEETKTKIANLKRDCSKISPNVVNMLLKHATSVKN
ncbi:V-type proton ATPase subunit G [Zostera marina]|uniref:V-type proton ATPase subunit G n=1 Tax=Zostera marina TaxID=29655 RepID=A0A0K9PMB7_ZOSMR|nr:V-type proton ATPase subunit G [Zostera marina]